MAFKKAERKQSKLRLALAGPAGSGKTMSALRLAKGLVDAAGGGKFALVDTEAGSGALYADRFDYGYESIGAPFTPQKYIEAIREAEREGFEVLIIDSLSHAWTGEGGILDKQGAIADKSGNSWTAWRTVTPQHNALVEAILQSKLHIIATMRSKMEYTQVEEDGKKKVKKLGMAPVQRDGMEYEFTVFMDITTEHVASASKDRTSLLDGKNAIITEETGKVLYDWLMKGASPAPQPEAKDEPKTIACPRKGNNVYLATCAKCQWGKAGQCDAWPQKPDEPAAGSPEDPVAKTDNGDQAGNNEGAELVKETFGNYKEGDSFDSIVRQAIQSYASEHNGNLPMNEKTVRQYLETVAKEKKRKPTDEFITALKEGIIRKKAVESFMQKYVAWIRMALLNGEV